MLYYENVLIFHKVFESSLSQGHYTPTTGWKGIQELPLLSLHEWTQFLSDTEQKLTHSVPVYEVVHVQFQ